MVLPKVQREPPRPTASGRRAIGASLGAMPHSPRVVLVLACLGAILASTCSGPIGATPRPTAADFEGLVREFTLAGIAVTDVVSGDPGCEDATLVGPAISFTAQGLDQSTPVRVRLYIFRNRDAYDRRRTDVDVCARQFVTDPATYEAVDAPPFVAVGQGPWGTRFRDAIRLGLQSGTGFPASPAP